MLKLRKLQSACGVLTAVSFLLKAKRKCQTHFYVIGPEISSKCMAVTECS